MNKSDEQIGRRAKELFDESVERLDAATLSRLNRGRCAALVEASRPGWQWSGWLPATGIAAAVLLAVIMLRGPGSADVIDAPAVDFDILLSEASIDMLEELEFYSWLDTQDLNAGSDVG